MSQALRLSSVMACALCLAGPAQAQTGPTRPARAASPTRVTRAPFARALGDPSTARVDRTRWPTAGASGPPGWLNPRREPRPIEALQITGGVVLALGYLGALISAGMAFGHPGVPGVSEVRDGTCHDAVGGTLLLPAIGGLLVPLTQSECRVPAYVVAGGVAHRGGEADIASEPGWREAGLITSLVQISGLALLLVGTLASTETTVVDERASLQLTPILGETNGLQVTLRY